MSLQVEEMMRKSLATITKNAIQVSRKVEVGRWTILVQLWSRPPTFLGDLTKPMLKDKGSNNTSLASLPLLVHQPCTLQHVSC
jgi:hypothetical protein